MGGERNAAPASRRPDVGATPGDLLERHVPPASDEPLRHEVDRAAFGTGGRVDGEQFGGERDDVCHYGKAS